MMKIKLVLTDIDGVWTDGGMYYSPEGDFMKMFNTSDSVGVLFLRKMKIPLGFISGEKNEILQKRADKLKIDYLYMGIQDKLKIVDELVKELHIKLVNVAYIGDDLNDIKVMKAVGLSAAPAQAPDYIKKYATWQMERKGGEGAFREFVERIVLTYWGTSFFEKLILDLA